MSSIACPGCKKPYVTGRSFQLHKKNCRHLSLATQDLFKKRQENIQQKASGAKIARYEDTFSDDTISNWQNLRDDINSDIDLPHTTPSESTVRFFDVSDTELMYWDRYSHCLQVLLISVSENRTLCLMKCHRHHLTFLATKIWHWIAQKHNPSNLFSELQQTDMVSFENIQTANRASLLMRITRCPFRQLFHQSPR